MSRNLLIAIAAAIAVVILVLFLPFGADDEEPMATDMAEEVDDASAAPEAEPMDEPADVGTMAEPQEETSTAMDEPAATDMTEGAGDADTAADVTEEPAAETMADQSEDTMTEPADEADVVGDETTESAEPAESASDEAMATSDTEGEAMEPTAELAQDEATDGIESESGAEMVDPEGLLTVLSADGFDFDRVVAIVEQSDQIAPTEKATLLAALDAARDDPDALAEVLERIREAMGV